MTSEEQIARLKIAFYEAVRFIENQGHFIEAQRISEILDPQKNLTLQKPAA